MAHGRVNISSGGGKAVEDIIKEYTAAPGEDIKIGDVCENINNIAKITKKIKQENEVINLNVNYQNKSYKQGYIRLDKNRSLIIYEMRTDSYSYYTEAIILKEIDNKIIKSEAVRVFSYEMKYMCVEKLNDNNVIIAGENYDGSGTDVVCLVINDMKATRSNMLSYSTYKIENKNIFKIDETGAVLFTQGTSSQVAIIFKITGTTLSQPTSRTLNNSFNNINGFSLTNGNFVVIDDYKGFCCTMLNATMSGYVYDLRDKSTRIKIIPGYTSTSVKVIKINDTRGVVFGYNLQEEGLKVAIIDTESGMNTYVTRIKKIKSTSHPKSYDVALIGENKILITQMDSIYKKLEAIVIEIQGDEIIELLNTSFENIYTEYHNIIEIGDNKAILHYPNNQTYKAEIRLIVIEEDGVKLHKEIEKLKPKIISMQNIKGGEKGKFLIKGTLKGIENLTPCIEYYCDDNGKLTEKKVNQKIGIALSENELLVNKGYWERKNCNEY